MKGLGIKAKDKEGNTYLAGSYSIAKDKITDSDHNVYLLKNEKVIATIDIEDELKPRAKETITWLKQGIKTILLSGDMKAKCEAIANELGMDEYHAEKRPEEKLQFIEELSNATPTAMVGDGINDAPALMRATIGISLSNATQAAIESAQVILLKGDLSYLVKAFKVNRHTLLTIKQNLFWAFFYNALAIPLAAIGLLNPMIAALSMAFSDVIVIGNSLRLRIKRIFR